HAGEIAEPGGEGVGQPVDLDEGGPPVLAMHPESLQGPADLLLRLLAHPRQLAQPLGVQGLLEAVDVDHAQPVAQHPQGLRAETGEDRKSTRLNSSHVKISYAVFCLKKKRNSSDDLF